MPIFAKYSRGTLLRANRHLLRATRSTKMSPTIMGRVGRIMARHPGAVRADPIAGPAVSSKSPVGALRSTPCSKDPSTPREQRDSRATQRDANARGCSCHDHHTRHGMNPRAPPVLSPKTPASQLANPWPITHALVPRTILSLSTRAPTHPESYCSPRTKKTPNVDKSVSRSVSVILAMLQPWAIRKGRQDVRHYLPA